MRSAAVISSRAALHGARRLAQLGDVRVAYHDEGSGPAVLLLHGCPFASFVWRRLIPQLAPTHRCDLLGLGDTETPPGADWSLSAQADTLIQLLDFLGIERAHVLGHDHGGAIAQVLAARHPARVDRLVLTDAEAYDNWPSAKERPFVRITQLPLVGDLVLWLRSRRVVLRATLVRAKAVHDARALSPEFIDLLVRANLSDRRRRAKTKRFLAGQFEPCNNRVTMDISPSAGGWNTCVPGLLFAIAGMVAMHSPKRADPHPRFGSIYYGCLWGVFVTAGALAAVRWNEDYDLAILGAAAFAAASVAHRARRKRWSGRRRLHIIVMGTSYILLLTAFYVDNGNNLPLWRDLSPISYWLLPVAGGLPLSLRALLRSPVTCARSVMGVAEEQDSRHPNRSHHIR